MILFEFFILSYRAFKSLPKLLYISGHVTLSAGTSISASPLTFTLRSRSANDLNPFWMQIPSNNNPNCKD
mgnify:CR=1 FL=1